jgi:hypothetical protein
MSDEQQAAQNHDVEIWRQTPGDYYSPSIHKTKEGAIGINVGGYVYVKDVREWHRLAGESLRVIEEAKDAVVEAARLALISTSAGLNKVQAALAALDRVAKGAKVTP